MAQGPVAATSRLAGVGAGVGVDAITIITDFAQIDAVVAATLKATKPIAAITDTHYLNQMTGTHAPPAVQTQSA